MKNFILKNYYRTGLLFLTGILFIVSFNSCGGKDDDAQPGAKGKTARFTVTINGANSNDYISFVVAGGTAGSTQNTLWKVNNVTRDNEKVIGLNKDNFTGSTKTYVIETAVPIDVASVGIQCIAYGHAYTLSFKAEINGEVKNNDQNVTVAEKADYTRNYTY